MGCDKYYINDIMVMFNELDDDVRCLCTFPYNDEKVLSIDRLRSLAMLGAAIVINHHWDENGPITYLPNDLPEWILDGIDKYLPKED